MREGLTKSAADRQKKMIEERDGKISELEGIVKGRFPYRAYNYLKMAGRKIKNRNTTDDLR